MTRESGSLDMSFNVVVDSLASTKAAASTAAVPTDVQIMHLLRDLVHGQQRQNELLGRILEQNVAARLEQLAPWQVDVEGRESLEPLDCPPVRR